MFSEVKVTVRTNLGDMDLWGVGRSRQILQSVTCHGSF